MSDNIIKWNYVQFDQEDKKIVKPAAGETLASSKAGREIMKQFHIGTPQDRADTFQNHMSSGKQEGFQEGIPIVNYDEMMEEQKKRMAEEANSLLSDAKNKAEAMIAEASAQADAIRREAEEKGRAEGLEEAAKVAEEESRARAEEYEKRRSGLEEEYLAKARKQEPFFAELVAQLVEKVTGVVIGGKQDIILHLLSLGIEEAGRSSHFLIHVSSEDYVFVEEQRDHIMQEIPEASLDIIEDTALSKNQCLIETDAKVIDSSLDIQLRNLTEDLKLLSLS